MDVRGHHLEEVAGKQLCCTRCLRPWPRLRSSRRWCPGVPWYTWGRAPDHLYTLSQLKRRGLTPRDRRTRDGCIVTAFHQVVSLYDISEAQPRRNETERQKASREAAWPRIQQKYTCAHCGSVPASLVAIRYEMHRPGLCLSCKERLEWQHLQEARAVQMEEDRRAACAWAYRLLRRSDWALIDTETTSLDGVVCEIGVLAGDGTVLFESLVNPESPVSPEARAIHGITDEELKASPPLPEVWPRLQEALRDRTTLVAYNAAFDRERLAQSARRSHLEVLTQEWACAMEAYAIYCGNWSDAHGSYTWIPYRLLHHHEAAQDATQEIFLRMWRYLGTFDSAKGALSSWLYRITVQVASDQAGYRKGLLATMSLDHLPWEVQDREAADPQTRYEGSAEQVAVALAVLPQHERLALTLRASGYREVEIARLVGKTPRTVRTWLALGRMHMAQAMEGAR